MLACTSSVHYTCVVTPAYTLIRKEWNVQTSPQQLTKRTVHKRAPRYIWVKTYKFDIGNRETGRVKLRGCSPSLDRFFSIFFSVFFFLFFFSCAFLSRVLSLTRFSYSPKKRSQSITRYDRNKSMYNVYISIYVYMATPWTARRLRLQRLDHCKTLYKNTVYNN